MEMSDNCGPDAYRDIVLNFDQVGVGSFNNCVVANPDAFSDLDPAPPMQPDA
jgi:hypothetical protein